MKFSTGMGQIYLDSEGASSRGDVYDDSRISTSYLQSFLPAFNSVYQSSPLCSASERLRAIQLAADASLATCGSESRWSDALCRRVAVEGSSPLLMEPCSSSSRCSGCFSDGLPTTSEVFTRHGLHRSGEREICGLSRVGVRLNRRSIRKLIRQSRLRRRLQCKLRTVQRWGSSRGLAKRRPVQRRVRSLARLRRTRTIRLAAHPQRENQEDLELESRFAALQRLVPGGSMMDTTSLLEETADFVIFLQMQVRAMEAVAAALDTM